MRKLRPNTQEAEMRTFRYMVRTRAPGVIGAISVLAAGKIARMIGMDPGEVTMVIWATAGVVFAVLTVSLVLALRRIHRDS